MKIQPKKGVNWFCFMKIQPRKGVNFPFLWSCENSTYKGVNFKVDDFFCWEIPRISWIIPMDDDDYFFVVVKSQPRKV